MKSVRTKRTVISALMMALAMVLPMFLGSIPNIGRSLLPMHIPVLLCGFLCGWGHGMAVGFMAPFLRFLIFGAPTIFPDAVGMAFELATYGMCAGILYQALPKKLPYAYVALIFSMLAGRCVWGLVKYRLVLMSSNLSFGVDAFFAGAFFNAVPGIILQIVLIPPLVALLAKFKINYNYSK